MASDPITSWQIEGKKVKVVRDFIFLGSKITANGDCSHEIKRCLLLGRKVMTNLDSILKSRDITDKGSSGQAMFFPVVKYGCECWTIKNTERWRINAFDCGVEEDSWESLGLQGDQTSQSWRKSTLNIPLEGLIVKLQYFSHLMWGANSLEKTRIWGKTEGRRRGQQRMRWLDSTTDSMD